MWRASATAITAAWFSPFSHPRHLVRHAAAASRQHRSFPAPSPSSRAISSSATPLRESEKNTMWDDRYGDPDYVYGEMPNDFMKAQALALLQENGGGKVLCLAEGEGRNAVWLAREQGHAVVAVDASKVGLDKADALAAKHGVTSKVRTVVADLGQYAVGGTEDEGTFDTVVVVFAHVPPPARPHMLQQAAMALKPGGLIILECYTARRMKSPCHLPSSIPLKTGGPPVEAMMFSLDELRATYPGESFEELVGREVVRPVIEGKYHTGDGAVVQYVVRKREKKMP